MKVGIFYFLDADHTAWSDIRYRPVYDQSSHEHIGWIRTEVVKVTDREDEQGRSPLEQAMDLANPLPDEHFMNTHQLVEDEDA